MTDHTKPPASQKIEVPDGCPCDFRYSGVAPSPEKCRHVGCGRTIGEWLGCPNNPGRSTPPPAASDAIEAAIIRYSLDTGFCDEKSMRRAIAAYHAALPSEFGELKKRLGRFSYASGAGWGLSEKLCADALAAITALEARLADAYERCAKIAENACLVPPDGGSPTEGEADVAEAAARAIRALAKGE